MTLEETTDEGADRRRIGRVCAALDEFVGDVPVELCLRMQGTDARFTRGGVDAARLDQFVPRLRALLCVLCNVEDLGVEPARREAGFVAVGGA